MSGMKTYKPACLGTNIDWYSEDYPEKLAIKLAEQVGHLLEAAILKGSCASLAVSGGSTPVRLFQALSKVKLDWSKVVVSLVDERWVEVSHVDSNEALVTKHLLQNNASQAVFIAIKNNAKSAKDGQPACEQALSQVKQPFDVVVLGMGNDGHTASLFPCSEELTLAMDPDYQHTCIATTPTSASYQRMSLSRSAISRANNIILHITGKDKLSTLELAMNNKDASQMPIYAFLTQPMSIYWCP